MKTPEDYMAEARAMAPRIVGQPTEELVVSFAEQARTYMALAVAQAQVEAARAQKEYWQKLSMGVGKPPGG